MPVSFGTRMKHAWNAFFNRDPTASNLDIGPSYYYKPDRVRFSRGNERSIVTSVYNRIALDVAAINIQHVRLDDNGRFIETIDSGLNSCLNLSANLDQTGRHSFKMLLCPCSMKDVWLSFQSTRVSILIPLIPMIF